jgi:hypothetical protein
MDSVAEDAGSTTRLAYKRRTNMVKIPDDKSADMGAQI